jgi:hypothetical protein
MSLITSLLLVAFLGAAGGIGNCLLAGGFERWAYDAAKNIWRPGWLGNVLIGAFAALVVWALYGPISGQSIVSGANATFPLPVAQIGGSILVGISGAKILSALADKQADAIAKKNLAETLEKVAAKLNG